MLFEIVRFELRYRVRQYSTYLYFILVLLFSMVAVDVVFEGQLGALKTNAPLIIARTMGILMALLLLIPSMIMGLAVLRDFEHRMEALLFVNPITKNAYLLGRFIGAFITLIFIFTAVPLGMMLGELMPWHQPEQMLPFNSWHYWQPFLGIVLPTLFSCSCLFFVTGALIRKLLVVYIQGFVLLLVYLLAINAASSTDKLFLMTLLEPFTFQTLRIATADWSPAARNEAMVPLTGALLYNRLLWTAIGVLILATGYRCFSFNVISSKAFLKRKRARQTIAVEETVTIPWALPQEGIKASGMQLLHHILFSCRTIMTSISFWVIVLIGMGVLFINSFNLSTGYGVNNRPATYLIVGELIELTWLFFGAVILFYSGELVWKERDSRMNQLYDALPISNLISLAGKLLGLLLTLILLMVTIISAGILFQSLHGYYVYELNVYVAAFLLEVFPWLLLLSIVCFVYQVLVNNKYLAQVVVLLFISISAVGFRLLGIDHGLLSFGGSLLPKYSDMNGYGHFLKPYLWFKTYWLAFAVFLLMIAVLFLVRGTAAGLLSRWRQSRLALTNTVKRISLVAIIVFVGSGSYIFYNTNILNRYASRGTQNKYRAEYERLLKPLMMLPQPTITAVTLQLDLYPDKRAYSAKGHYTLFNPGLQPIHEIHIQKLPTEQVQLKYLTVASRFATDSTYSRFGYYILKLQQPLQPGDSLQLDFQQYFEPAGFTESANTFVVYNGTFIDNDHLPAIGYNHDMELREAVIRARYGLQPQPAMAMRNDAVALREGKAHGDGEEICFDATISTNADQSVVAPGNLQASWVTQERRYFHYVSNKPMANTYAILSARYKTLRQYWHREKEKVTLEIDHHPGHTVNLQRMINGMKQSLDYYSAHFAPYRYQQLRLAETPVYNNRGQAFPTLIALAENVGFIMDIDDTTAMDIPFFIAAHETAHQWWGDWVNPANVQGKTMLSESLAQYSALMVFKQAFSEEKLNKLLRWNRMQYLNARSSKATLESPLSLVASNQEYVHYRKGMLSLHALQHYITEDSVNKALQRFAGDWNSYDGLKKLRTNRYPNAADLLEYFKAVTADSMQYLIHDLFESVILYDNKLRQVNCQALAENQYAVTVMLEMKKIRIDNEGNEKPAVLNDWVELGIYAKDEQGKEKLVSIQKIRVNKEHTMLKFSMYSKPSRVVLDPHLLFIDKSLTDNEKPIDQ